MRILCLHNFYQQPGGEDQVFAAETSLLEAHGHQIIRFTVKNHDITNISSLTLAAKTIWNRSLYRELRQLIRLEKPQIAHFHNTLPLISPAAYYAAKAERIPVVQTLHNYRLLCPNAEFFRQGKVCEDCLGKTIPISGIVHACYRENRLATSVVATMLSTHRLLGTWTRKVDRYIALTEFARQKCIKGGLPAEKIVTKPNFVYPNSKVGSGKGNYALFVGRLTTVKGVKTLLAAWEQSAQALPLKIVGDGPLAKEVIKASEQTSGVTWLGRKSSEEVYELMGEATCLVFPSEWYEGLPRTIIEAFAMRTPVVASKIGAIVELIDHGRTGLLFQPGNPDDLAQQIHWLLAHPEQLAKMRLQARSEFEAKYTPERNYQQLMEIYRSLDRSTFKQLPVFSKEN